MMQEESGDVACSGHSQDDEQRQPCGADGIAAISFAQG
jgi:hypothetical protein